VSKEIRWGVVGPGRIAEKVVEDFAVVDGARAVAVASRSQARADDFAARHGLDRAYGSYKEILADPDVDVLYVATPHPQHHAIALAAIRAGKAVLVEKAFTATLGGAEEIVAEARSRGVFAMEAMWTRFQPAVVRARELLAEGAIGSLVSVQAELGIARDFDPSDRLFAPELGGGALLDLGIYPVSFASMVLGTPDRVRAIADPAFTGVDAQTSILLGYESGAHALLNCTLRAVGSTRASIVGTDARIEIDGAFYQPTSFTLIPREGEPQRMFDPPAEGGLRHEADEVARRIGAGELESPEMPLDETVAIMRTMDAVRAATA
jgi:predicted dehydrogenase